MKLSLLVMLLVLPVGHQESCGQETRSHGTEIQDSRLVEVLTPLSWLVGDWVSNHGKIRQLSVRPSSDGKELRMVYSMDVDPRRTSRHLSEPFPFLTGEGAWMTNGKVTEVLTWNNEANGYSVSILSDAKEEGESDVEILLQKTKDGEWAERDRRFSTSGFASSLQRLEEGKMLKKTGFGVPRLSGYVYFPIIFTKTNDVKD